MIWKVIEKLPCLQTESVTLHLIFDTSMNISLASFEQEIEEVILERGWRYFKKGNVTGFAELSPGEYEATVKGTGEYQVSFQVQHNLVIDPVCTCPYEGPVCKHVSAVIFYYTQEAVADDGMREQPLPKKKSRKKTVAKKKSIGEQVEEILKQLSADELQSFIRVQSKKSDDFARSFLSRYAHLFQDSSKELFVKQLQSQLRSLSGRRGFIDYSQARYVYVIGREFNETATTHFQQKRYLLAWHMACAALEVFTEVLQYADDSNGDVGACITDASELMVSIANEELPDELRGECFRYCTKAYRDQLFSGWDWHELQMDIAIQLVNSKEEAAELHNLLDMVKPSREGWYYDMRRAEVQRYCLLRKMDGDEEANAFLLQNLHNSDLREHLIEQLVVVGRYDEAIRFCEEGIRKDGKNFPGLVDKWREWLLKIYLLKKDTDNIVNYAFKLFVSSNLGGDDLYKLLKEHVPAENWEDMVQKIVQAIRKNERVGEEYRIATIYLREQYWDELFGLLKKNPTFTFLDEFEKHMPDRFADDINQMYMGAVNKLLIENTGRKFYETACRYLRKLKKRGAVELVEMKIKQLRRQYPQRRALMDELNLV